MASTRSPAHAAAVKIVVVIVKKGSPVGSGLAGVGGGRPRSRDAVLVVVVGTGDTRGVDGESRCGGSRPTVAVQYNTTWKHSHCSVQNVGKTHM